MQFLKRLFFGQPDHSLPPVDIDSLAGPDATLDEIVAANIRLGEVVDKLRAERRALNERAAQLRKVTYGR